jgi:hypothetical protein
MSSLAKLAEEFRTTTAHIALSAEAREWSLTDEEWVVVADRTTWLDGLAALAQDENWQAERTSIPAPPLSGAR